MPGLGIRGAAIATLISRAAELLCVLWENRKKEEVCIRWTALKNGGGVLQRDFCRYTGPVLANELVWGS